MPTIMLITLLIQGQWLSSITRTSTRPSIAMIAKSGWDARWPIASKPKITRIIPFILHLGMLQRLSPVLVTQQVVVTAEGLYPPSMKCNQESSFHCSHVQKLVHTSTHLATWGSTCWARAAITSQIGTTLIPTKLAWFQMTKNASKYQLGFRPLNHDIPDFLEASSGKSCWAKTKQLHVRCTGQRSKNCNKKRQYKAYQAYLMNNKQLITKWPQLIISEHRCINNQSLNMSTSRTRR